MLKRGILILFAAVVLAALAVAPARAQFGAIEGDIKDPDGKPMAGVRVVIERIDIKGTYNLKEKDIKKGHFFHGGLPLGRYNVKLLQGEQVLDAVNGVRVGLGDPTKVDFDLKASRDRAMAAQAGIKLEPKAGGGQQGEAAPQLTKEQRAQIEAMQKAREASKEKAEKLNKNFAAGVEALKIKNYDVAITEFEAAALADATQHVVFAQLGEAYLGSARGKRGEEAMAHFGKSIEHYTKAITLKPDSADYYNNYGLALASSGKGAEAQEALNKAAQLDPPNAGRYFFNLGAVQVNAGRGKEATEAFRKATAADPNYAEAWYQLGVSLLSDAKVDTSSGKTIPAAGTNEAFQKYLELQPAGPNAENAKGMIATLGGTVQTSIKAEKGAKKR